MKTRARHTLLVGVSTLALAVVSSTPALAGPGASAGGSAKSGYNAIPSKVTGNVPSEGFEATATTEFGDAVTLGGTARTLKSMSVLLSSWGCQSGHWYSNDCVTTAGATFTVPLTFTVYNDVGAVVAAQTQTVAVAYRPSASTRCTDGRWYNSKDRSCYNGLPQTVTMTFSPVTLTDAVTWSVAYSTTHYGAAPIGETATCFGGSGGCGYDSLNVGAFTFQNSPYAGTDVDADAVFRNGAMESGWTGNRPLGALVTG